MWLRNYFEKEFSVSPEELMLKDSLGLSTVELTVLYGGLRSVGSHTGDGIWTNGRLDNSWFKTLLSMDVNGKKQDIIHQAKNRSSLKIERKASKLISFWFKF